MTYNVFSGTLNLTQLNSFNSPPYHAPALSLPSLPIEVGPLKSSQGVWWSAVSSPSEVWGGASAETNLCI